MPLQTIKSMVTSQEAIPGFVRDTTTTFKHEHRSERNISGFCQITDVSKPNITKKEQDLSLLCKLFIFNQSMVSSCVLNVFCFRGKMVLSTKSCMDISDMEIKALLIHG